MQEMEETQVWSLGQEDPLEEGMATHSGILARRIPWTEEPSGLKSTGSQRVGHDWSDLACHLRKKRPWNWSLSPIGPTVEPLPLATWTASTAQIALWSRRIWEQALTQEKRLALWDDQEPEKVPSPLPLLDSQNTVVQFSLITIQQPKSDFTL